MTMGSEGLSRLRRLKLGARLRRLLRPRTLAVVVPGCMALVVLEMGARLAKSDLGDAVTLVFLVLMVFLVALRHELRPVPGLNTFGQRCRRLVNRLARWRLAHGVDLRESPPWPEGPPRAWGRALPPLILAGLAATALGLFRHDAVDATRGALTRISHLAWVLALAVVWAVYASGIAVFMTLILSSFLPSFTPKSQTGKEHAHERAAVTGGLFVIALMAAITWLPVWIAVVATLAPPLLWIAWNANRRGPSMEVLWRWNTGPVRSEDWRRLFGIVGLLIAFIVIAIGAWGSGAAMTKGFEVVLDTRTPITHLLALGFLWSAAAAQVLAFAHLAVRWGQGRRNDPSRHRPVSVWVSRTDPHRREILELARLSGLREADVDDTDAVRMRSGSAQGVVIREGWVEVPLGADPQDVRDVVGRRDRRQRRRRAVRQIRRIFKVVKSMGRGQGHLMGFVPHRWFIDGVFLEGPGEAEEGAEPAVQVGPLSVLLSPAVRAYLHRVFHDLAVDVLFVDLSLSWPQLQSALAVLFETHDIFGGRREVLPADFAGLHGVNVVIHEEGFFSDALLIRARALFLLPENGGGDVLPDSQPAASKILPHVGSFV